MNGEIEVSPQGVKGRAGWITLLIVLWHVFQIVSWAVLWVHVFITHHNFIVMQDWQTKQDQKIERCVDGK